MPRILLLSIKTIIGNLENLFAMVKGSPPALAMIMSDRNNPTTQTFSLKDVIGDGFLWAVPKHRRSVEKRLNRKFGFPEYVWKPLKEKRNLRSCLKCGHEHELGVLCSFCYDIVRKETHQMQEKIQESLGVAPIDQEVVVLYDGENDLSPEALKGSRVVEIQKPRPMWFTKNLLQKSIQQSADTKEVKPSDLG
ncbi:large ribosomal subunit protein bL32m [Drosophila nasuta]|uniref:large ribosomal subunit protein bL32m n=1 Tax=Drosophila nasuta TaxID=42062 RepID=UPI00295E7EF6|nr:large ribosomal subunit protein bL32m [Drosophila nasuta]